MFYTEQMNSDLGLDASSIPHPADSALLLSAEQTSVPGTARQPNARTRGRRRYDDGCAAAHALDLVGERWALLIVRELLLGPRRFTDLRQSLCTISPNVLTQRLGDLESAAVIEQRELPPPAACRVYALTHWGMQLEPVLMALLKWGVRSPAFIRGSPLTADAMALSFKAMFDPSLAGALSCNITLFMGGNAYPISVDDGRLTVARGAPPCRPADIDVWPCATLSAEPVVVLQLAYGRRPLEHAEAAGECRHEGDTSTLRKFLACFRVPPVNTDS